MTEQHIQRVRTTCCCQKLLTCFSTFFTQTLMNDDFQTERSEALYHEACEHLALDVSSGINAGRLSPRPAEFPFQEAYFQAAYPAGIA